MKFTLFFVERISACTVTEKLAEHGIHCLSCSNTNVVIDLLPQQLTVHFDAKKYLSSATKRSW